MTDIQYYSMNSSKAMDTLETVCLFKIEWAQLFFLTSFNIDYFRVSVEFPILFRICFGS